MVPLDTAPLPRTRFSARRTHEELVAHLPTRRLSPRARRAAEAQLLSSGTSQWLASHAPAPTQHTGLSRTRRALLRKVFGLLDADGSGAIDAGELGLAMRGLGFAPAAIAEAVHAADRDGDGELDLDEFLALVVACTAAAGGSLPSAPLDAESFAVVATSHHVHSLVESFNPARDGPISRRRPARRHAARRAAVAAPRQPQRPAARVAAGHLERPTSAADGADAAPHAAPPRSPRSPPPRSPPSPRTRHRSPPRTAAAALPTIDGGGGARPWVSPRPTDMAMGETAKPKGRAPRAAATSSSRRSTPTATRRSRGRR